jgi:TPR repeat protein
VPQDLVEAVRLFRLAALQDNAPGQCMFGLLYVSGAGVAQDYVEAARLLRLSAAQGFALAQCNLGKLYADGAGVAQDYVEAARWLWPSAQQGLGEASDLLEALSCERAYVSACCMGCGATRKLKACAKCKVARFCTAECQRRTWAEHKPHCKLWAAHAAAEA